MNDKTSSEVYDEAEATKDTVRACMDLIHALIHLRINDGNGHGVIFADLMTIPGSIMYQCAKGVARMTKGHRTVEEALQGMLRDALEYHREEQQEAKP